MAVRCFDPARGASLLTHLAAQRVWSGEAVATAALPIGAPVSRADRRASWLAGDGVATVLSLDADPALGEMAGPDRGQEAFERELDVRSAMRSLDGRDREWLTAAYGLGGARMIPTEDLAAAEGVSVHTVRRSLAHSREALRDSLSELAFSN
jgi:DNA-directed RNA polymerase specialized sigma24 family protein